MACATRPAKINRERPVAGITVGFVAATSRRNYFFGLGLPASLRFLRQVPSLFRSRGAVPPPGIFTCGTLPARRSAIVDLLLMQSRLVSLRPATIAPVAAIADTKRAEVGNDRYGVAAAPCSGQCVGDNEVADESIGCRGSLSGVH